MGIKWKSNKKLQKILGATAVAMLLAVGFRVITEQAFLAQASMEGAFAVLTPGKSAGTVTMTARYLPPPYGFSEVKLLVYFCEKIGLVMDGEVREAEFLDRREVIYEKQAAQAHSVIKVVCLTEAELYYVCAEVTLTGENASSVATFQKNIKETAKAMGLEEITTTLELCGTYDGEIPLAEKDALTDRLLEELYAQPIYENRENTNYTVYAYTGAVEEYIVVEKKKINVQIALYYDRESDCTEVVLASPIGLR